MIFLKIIKSFTTKLELNPGFPNPIIVTLFRVEPAQLEFCEKLG